MMFFAGLLHVVERDVLSFPENLCRLEGNADRSVET
ncbi:hypothetical protein J2S04_000827 [Alicyclobacillus tengchongensis]|uniref:Uncharacterized protein n=1 Tax=Alicyclobacillus tolerans TaxID=90970 RepID=A0ABT9LUG9_9BACL|nr:hypothetical protein [Alicyclobacillus tengchongensis]